MERKRFHTITEAAKALGITRAAVHRAIKQGRLEASRGKIVQVTQGWRITSKSLEGYRVSTPHQQAGKKTPERLIGYIPFPFDIGQPQVTVSVSGTIGLRTNGWYKSKEKS